jgi:hypothetical protein
MANITEILGTDSVSSSRPVINSNFELLNDELASVVALINPTTGVLSGLSSATTQQLNVVDGSALLSVSSAGATFGTAATMQNVNLGGKLIKSGVVGTAAVATTNTAPSNLDKSNYFIDGEFTLPVGDDGQEVTLINVANSAVEVKANTGQGAALAATSIRLDGLNSTITLRCFNTVWYVVGSHKVTVQ